jgi:hypothetical protein
MKKLALLDICHPEYFSGYHLPVFAIPMYDGVTFEDVAKQIETDINVDYTYYITKDGIKEKDEKLIHQFVNEYKSKGNEVFYKDENECIVEDQITYDDDCPYAYFSIVDLKVINGITFLS